MAPEPSGNGKGQEKGKGKERGDLSPVPGSDSNSGGTDSMLSRITNSTVGLASSMLSGTPSSSVLAKSIAGEKGSSSTAAGSITRQGESSIPIQQDIPKGPSFRATQAQDHAAAEEAAFADFLDSADELTTPGPNDLELAWQYHIPTPSKLSTGFSSVAEQQRHDGEDVVSLLMQDSEQFELPEEETISPEEMESLRRALFGNSNGLRRQIDLLTDPMNFIPDHLRLPETEHYVQLYMDKKDREATTGVRVPDGSEAIRDEMDVSDAQNEEARQTFAWLEQWDGVLTSYLDEVWGDFGGLLKQARAEYEELEKAEENHEPPPETKALGRLRAILGHLRRQ